MLRISKPEKWKDSFFMNLKPIEKLLFIYIYENCDDAGFFEVNFKNIIADVGIDSKDLSPSLKKLEKTFLLSDDGEKVWLKKFLLHQNKLPLDLKTPEGNYIKFQLESNYEKFGNPKEFEYILESLKNIKTSNKKNTIFVKPELKEVIEHFKKDKKWNIVPEDEINKIYKHYEDKGWTVGKNKTPMQDWVKAFSYCFSKNKKYKENTNNKQDNHKNNIKPNQTKMEILFQENQKLEGFDYSQLKTNKLF